MSQLCQGGCVILALSRAWARDNNGRQKLSGCPYEAELVRKPARIIVRECCPELITDKIPIQTDSRTKFRYTSSRIMRARFFTSAIHLDAVVAPFRSIIAQIMALGNMEAGFDFLLDLRFGFLLRYWLPILHRAETQIG